MKPVLFSLALCFSSAASATPGTNPEGGGLRIDISAAKPKAGEVGRRAAEAGLAAFAKNDLETARKNFKKLLEAAPENLTALVNLGSVEYRLNHLDEAEKVLQRAVRINPDAGLAWLTLGVVYNSRNKLDAALAALSEAVLLEPKDARGHNALAGTLWRRGWDSAAEDELQKSIELDPDFADAHFNLALAYLRRTPPAIELARRHYQKSRDLGAASDSSVEKQLSSTP